MTTRTPNLYATLDDIIFEGRNREYGAYLLRKIYPDHLKQASLIAFFVAVLFVSLPLIANYFQPAPVVPPIDPPAPLSPITVVLPKVVPPVVEPAQPTSPPPAKAVPTQQLTNIQVVNNPVKPADILDQDVLSKTNIGNTTVEGKPGTPAIIPTEETGAGSGIAEPVAPPIFKYAEQMPQFPGGEAALMKFLNSNISYPALATRNGLEGLIVVSFVVNAQGNIADIQVIKKLGGGLDEEAIRVVKLMPRWSPGLNSGTPVNVRFNLPIRFSIR